MYAAQHANEIHALTATAARLGVTLPADLDAQARHLAALQEQQRTTQPPAPAQSAVDLTAHLGNPASMSKALAKAAADLANAEAQQRILSALVDRCASVVRQRFRQSADAILDAFKPALGAALATLNEDAHKLPQAFKVEHAADLDPETFAAWTRVRDAYALLESIQSAVRPLYTTAANDVLTPEAVRALRYVNPPQLDNPSEAATFARALAGIRHGGSTVGPVNLDGIFAPAAVAHLGATFAWGNASTVAARAEAITTAATPRKSGVLAAS
ncbi:hypothetical protein GCM10027039_01800 [Terrabacter koreensis]